MWFGSWMFSVMTICLPRLSTHFPRAVGISGFSYTVPTRICKNKKASRFDWPNCLILLVETGGIEPPTY